MNEISNTIRSGVQTHTIGSLEFSYDIQVETKKKNGIWIATAPSFKSLGYSQKGLDGAINDQYDDVNTFLNVHVGLGSLERALKNLGWTKQKSNNKNEIVFYHKDLKSVIKYKHKRKP